MIVGIVVVVGDPDRAAARKGRRARGTRSAGRPGAEPAARSRPKAAVVDARELGTLAVAVARAPGQRDGDAARPRRHRRQRPRGADRRRAPRARAAPAATGRPRRHRAAAVSVDGPQLVFDRARDAPDGRRCSPAFDRDVPRLADDRVRRAPRVPSPTDAARHALPGRRPAHAHVRDREAARVGDRDRPAAGTRTRRRRPGSSRRRRRST